ncbi:sensor histidine kinase [Gracilibacillus dipsosauri]|uniref:sensor histidine kinase n=1 Tax=Gracilibacillus dipsosauri TaxID=178340 RepID=UPI0024094638
MKRLNKLRNDLQSLSLKSRIAILFAISTFIPLMFTVLFSYHTMSTILTNKLHTNFNSNLHQISLTIENTINDMNYVSQQIDFSENIQFRLKTYLKMEDSLEKTRLYEDIKNELNLITFSNPNIGLSLIYVEKENKYLFNSHGVKDEFHLRNQPLFIKGYKIDNFGPHVSMERYNDKYVLSTVRQLDMDYENHVYLYMESNLDLTRNIVEKDNVLNHTSYLLLNKQNEVIYSEEQEEFPLQTPFFREEHLDEDGTRNGYYWFKQTTDRGWSVVSLISIAQYKQEINQWMILMLYMAILFVLVSLIVGLLLWKTFYRPLHQLNSEIKLMSNHNFASEVVSTKIPEFVDLLSHFRKMKKQITNLIQAIEQKERNRADLEVEKLLHQINPHFLMNTLDTARWLAVAGNKEEVTHLLTALNKLLYYNMGKLGNSSTLNQEIDSVKQYLELQQIRYDFDYKIELFIADSLLESSVPRFILQPIVENSIYHGLEDDGSIRIAITNDPHNMMIKVSDNGRGMSEEDIQRVWQKDQQKEKGMGIGLHYVKQILDRTYEGRASIDIFSSTNDGTDVVLTIPIGEEFS